MFLSTFLVGGNLVVYNIGLPHTESRHEPSGPDLSSACVEFLQIMPGRGTAERRTCTFPALPDNAKWFPRVCVPIYTSHRV